MKWNWQQPDWPNWQFDSEALQEMERQFLVGSGRLAGAWQHLSQDNQDQVKVNLLSDEAMKSSEIEGEYLDRDSVQSSVRRQFGMQAALKSKPAESGIAELMVACFKSSGAALDEKTLLGWHSLVCRGREDLHSIGEYRQHADAMQVVSGRIDRPKVHFEAPPSKDVPAHMQAFFGWMQKSQLGALAKAGLAHLYFVSIHPFEDGNGRLARAISEHVFTRSLGQPSLLALSRQIEKDRKHYYDALEANNKRLEVTPWLLWFAETALKSQAYSASLIEHIISKTRLLDTLRGQLNVRQEKALLRMFDTGPDGFIGGMSAKNYMKITDTTSATTTRDLGDLVAKGALRRTGERKATRYWLNIS